MPLLDSAYAPPWFLRNGHALTLYPVLTRRVPPMPGRRVRLTTFDDDFIDVDVWPGTGGQGRRAVILSHGLEGNSRRKYMRGMGRALARRGWDVFARNIRNCSGEPSKSPRHYHMGATEDLHTVVEYCLSLGYAVLALVGFSMGGSQTLKYLSEAPERVPSQVRAAVAVSVPCDLVASSERLAAPACRIYMMYFLRTLRRKMRIAAARHPDFPSLEGLEAMRTFNEFDERFTAPINGFASAHDYWSRNGCGQFLPRLRVPALLLNAQDDPFMNAPCYPVDTARENPCLFLEMPRHGGHVGFVLPGEEYWSEQRAAAFLQEHCAV